MKTIVFRWPRRRRGRVLANWILAMGGAPEAEVALTESLSSDDAQTRRMTAHAIGRLEKVDPATFDVLQAALFEEAAGSGVYLGMLGAWNIHCPEEQKEQASQELLRYADTDHEDRRLQLYDILAHAGDLRDVGFLERMLDDQAADVRISAANALLRIERRQQRGLQWIDWTVIGLYGAFMLGIGWYYSRRQTSSEEYLVAGHSMGSVAVGISIFATLLSTISFLALPGEIIKHGPFFLVAGTVILPVLYFVIGYWLIPHFMRSPITSAYQILEGRLGVRIRLLGSRRAAGPGAS